MLKTLKFKGDEANYFFVSDLHYNHNRDFIYTKRKGIKENYYQSESEHANGIIEVWNQRCNNQSIVFNLGDITFNDGDGEKFKTLVRRLNFKTMYLLYGNHTSGHRQVYLETLKAQHPNAFNDDGTFNYEVYPLKMAVDGNPNKVVIFVPQYAEALINSTQIVLCHYPIISHNEMGHMSIHCCGHSHGSCEFTNKDIGHGFRLDVGVESFGGPINLLEVKHHLKDRQIESYDHHNPLTTRSK